MSEEKNKVTIYGVSLEKDTIVKNSIIARRNALEQAKKAYKAIYDDVLKCKDGTELHTLIENQGWNITKDTIKWCIDFMERNNKFEYDFDRYYGELTEYFFLGPDNNFILGSKYGMFDYELTCLETAIGDIVGDKESVKALNEYRKAGRGKVVGGGFGVSGAMKGMATAGAINMATGAAYSIANVFSNAAASSKCRKELKGLVNKNRAEQFAKAIMSDVLAIHKLMIESVFKIRGYYDEKTEREADIMFQKLQKNEYSDVQKKALMGQILIKKPYDIELIEFAYKNFGLDDGNLNEFVIYCFGKTLESALQELLQKEKEEAAVLEALGEDYTYIYDRFIKNNNYYKKEFQKIFVDESPVVYLDKLIRNKLQEKNESDKDILRFGVGRAWQLYSLINVEAFLGVTFRDCEYPLYIVDEKSKRIIVTTEGIFVNEGYISYKDIKEKISKKEYISLLSVEDYWNQCLIYIIMATYPYMDIQAFKNSVKEDIDTRRLHYTTEAEVISLVMKQINHDDKKYVITNEYSKKFIAAKNAYLDKLGFNENEEVVVVCFDNTMLNSGEKGFVITSKYTYVRDSGKPIRFSCDRGYITTKGLINTSVVFEEKNKKHAECFSLMNKRTLELFLEILNKFY